VSGVAGEGESELDLGELPESALASSPLVDLFEPASYRLVNDAVNHRR
jgi:hypothetical protein